MGLHKKIENPDILYSLFLDYKKNIKSNPLKKMDFKGKEAETVYYEIERPLTMVGFENYVFEQGLNSELSHYFSNKDKRYNDFVAICSRIRGFIKQDQIEGGMASIYNPSITQRLNGLVDKKEHTVKEEPRVFKID